LVPAADSGAVSNLLNRLFSLMQSFALGFSQVCYDAVHSRHHRGNSDKVGEDGDTIDWASIYRHGHDDEAESVWAYTFFSYVRDDPWASLRELKTRSAAEARWGLAEIVGFMSLFIVMAIVNWKFMLFFIPFYYFGHCLSYLNGYYLHYGADPDQPIAWGVSSYHKALQLDLVQQRLSRRAPFPAQDALDPDEGIPAADFHRPGSRWCARDRAAPRARRGRNGSFPAGCGRGIRARHPHRRAARDAAGVAPL
jgi:hypothetical protein